MSSFGQAVFIDRFIDNRIKIGWVAVILRLAFIGIDQLAMDIHSCRLISRFLVNIASRHHILEDRVAAIGRIFYLSRAGYRFPVPLSIPARTAD